MYGLDGRRYDREYVGYLNGFEESLLLQHRMLFDCSSDSIDLNCLYLNWGLAHCVLLFYPEPP